MRFTTFKFQSSSITSPFYPPPFSYPRPSLSASPTYFQTRTANMKLIAVIVGFQALSLSALAIIPYAQASRLIPQLAPRIADYHASAKSPITHNDSYQKNFTHDELFTLQKRFLDNFIAPRNAIQVRFAASQLRFTSTK